MNAGPSTTQSTSVGGDPTPNPDGGQGEVELIDGVPRVFLERLEDVFDNCSKLYLQLRTKSADQDEGTDPLHDKYNMELLISVLDDKGNARFSVGRLKNSPESSAAKQIQFLVVTDRGDAILTVEQYGFLGARYEISGAGVLGFSLRRTTFGNFLAFDKWKNLFKIHSWWLRLTPRCLAGRRPTTVNVKNLDGTWTGALAYNLPAPAGGAITTNPADEHTATSITFAQGLNRKAKYIMFAACLIPFSSHFWKKRRGTTS